MSKRSFQKQIRSLDLRIKEHKDKILTENKKPHPDQGKIRHWTKEIKTFEKSLEKARKRLEK